MKTSGLIPLLAAVMALIFISMDEVKGADTRHKSFEGLIIYLDEGEVLVKKGSHEAAFQLGEQVALEKSKAAVKETRLALCQRIKIWYEIKEGKKLAVKIQILTPGYCGP